jgi:hypothetical protein
LIGLGSGNTPTFLGASLTGGTVTASAPLIDATQTWNSAGTVFTGMRLNVTDTASNASSLLMDLRVGGSSRIAINKNSSITVSRSGNTAVITDTQRSHCVGFPDGNLALGTSSTFLAGISIRDLGCTVASSQGFHWNSAAGLSGGTPHASLMSDSANTLAQRNWAGNAQTFRIYNTFTDSSNYERGKLEWSSNVLRIGTEKAGTGSARALELQTDGTTRLTIGTDGSTVFAGPSSQFGSSTTACIISSNAGLARIDFLAGGSYVGNINASSNTLRLRAPSGVAVRNNNDTADADITAAALTLSGNLTISTKNIVTDTTTGTKIGTGITQKLAFWNATPVVQPTAVADATDAASVITQLNALLSRMRTLGLIAT